LNLPIHEMNRFPDIIKLFTLVWALLVFAFPEDGLGQKKINPEHYDAQDTDSVPVYHYDVLRNKPDSVGRFTIRLNPLDYYSFGIYELQGQMIYQINQSFEISGSAGWLISAYYDPYFPGIQATTYSGQLGHFEFCGIYNFINITKTGRLTTYFKIPQGQSIAAPFFAKKVWKLGVKLGANYIKTAVTSDQVNFVGFNVNDPSMQKTDFNTIANEYSKPYGPVSGLYTTASMSYFSLGLQSEKINDFEIKIDKSIKRKVRNKTLFYADLIVSPYISYDNIVFKSYDSIPTKTFNVDKYSPKQLLGFRCGWDYYSLRTFGPSLGAEFGIMPNSGFYIMIKMGLAINPKFIVGDNYDSYK